MHRSATAFSFLCMRLKYFSYEELGFFIPETKLTLIYFDKGDHCITYSNWLLLYVLINKHDEKKLSLYNNIMFVNVTCFHNEVINLIRIWKRGLMLKNYSLFNKPVEKEFSLFFNTNLLNLKESVIFFRYEMFTFYFTKLLNIMFCMGKWGAGDPFPVFGKNDVLVIDMYLRLTLTPTPNFFLKDGKWD